MTYQSSYTASIDDLPEATPCECGDCEWRGPFSALAEIGDCILTPGDGSPAGRCPECDTLAYINTPETRCKDAAPAMLAALNDTDEYCQAGLNSADPAHWEAALRDIMALARAAIAAATGTPTGEGGHPIPAAQQGEG